MKILLINVFLAFLLTSLYGDEWTLTIEAESQQDYQVSTLHKLIFTSSLDTMQVKEDGGIVTNYLLGNIKKMIFTEGWSENPTNIKKTKTIEYFKLYQNYPNPFNPTTTIRFNVLKAADVTVKIYDMSGREIRTLNISKAKAGLNELKWDGRNSSGNLVSTGQYIYSVKIGENLQTKKMVLLK